MVNLNFQDAGFTTPAVSGYVTENNPVYYNANNGKITLFLYGGTYTDPDGVLTSFTLTSDTSIVFYDFTGVLQCSVNCVSNVNHYFNNTLGWLMGYKLPYVTIDTSGNAASSVLDLNGTKYLILVLDDYTLFLLSKPILCFISGHKTAASNCNSCTFPEPTMTFILPLS